MNNYGCYKNNNTEVVDYKRCYLLMAFCMPPQKGFMVIALISHDRKMFVLIPYRWLNRCVESLNDMSKFCQLMINRERKFPK